MIIEDCVDMLGKTGKDKITGSKGIVTSVSFDLYGCIQVILNPGKVGADGKEIACVGWIDVNRVRVVKEERVMEHPDFDVKYGETKSIHGSASKPV